jgi:hypothetical protein
VIYSGNWKNDMMSGEGRLEFYQKLWAEDDRDHDLFEKIPNYQESKSGGKKFSSTKLKKLEDKNR